MNLRWIVLKILDTIEFEGVFVHDAIERHTGELELSKQERSFIKRLVFGTIENRIYLDYIINDVSKVKVKKMKSAIRHILRMAVYQIYFMDQIPESAVCNEAVKLAKKRKMHALGGFVNGVLRQVIRSKGQLALPDSEKEMSRYLSVKYSFEEEMIQYLLKELSVSQVKDYLSVNNEKAPITIRANTHRCTKEALVSSLESEGVVVTSALILDNALHIDGFDRIQGLDAFKKGWFNVQDESSMLVGEVAYNKAVHNVIDVCSAPGGKTLHIADSLGDEGLVKAYDVSDNKVAMIRENVSRLGYNNVEVAIGDARMLNESLVETADLLIVDVPCSGLGIIRKKPDIKWHMSLQKISDLVALQREIVENVKAYVKPGGTMIYSTCTITRAENEDNVEWFLNNNHDFELVKIEEPYGDATSGMIRLLPTSGGYDGFFIAKFRKKV